MFQCHFNVEICISKVGSIKYLFKYVCKGQDRVSIEVKHVNHDGNESALQKTEQVSIDEIKNYQDARYLSATEADWRLRGYSIVEHDPSVVRLEVHLEGEHIVYFNEGEENEAMRRSEEKRTKLMAWFNANSNYPSASHIRYVDFPKYFTWNKSNRSWHPRVQYKVSHSSTTAYEFSRPPQKVVGRMYNASPREGERYFLRTLLLHNQVQILSRASRLFKVLSKIHFVTHAAHLDFFLTIRNGSGAYKKHSAPVSRLSLQFSLLFLHILSLRTLFYYGKTIFPSSLLTFANVMVQSKNAMSC